MNPKNNLIIGLIIAGVIVMSYNIDANPVEFVEGIPLQSDVRGLDGQDPIANTRPPARIPGLAQNEDPVVHRGDVNGNQTVPDTGDLRRRWELRPRGRRLSGTSGCAQNCAARAEAWIISLRSRSLAS